MKTATVLIALALLASSTFASAERRANRAVGASTYRETAIFNHVVGGDRFVGAFVAAPGRCDVTVFETRADDRSLAAPLRRFVLPIAAGARGELAAAPGSALTISCAAKADAIRIAPQTDGR